jgi:hypothetical protein
MSNKLFISSIKFEITMNLKLFYLHFGFDCQIDVQSDWFDSQFDNQLSNDICERSQIN